MFDPDTSFVTVADVTNKFVVCIGMDGNYCYGNSAFFQRFRIDSDNLEQRHSLADIHPDDHQLVMDTVGRCCGNLNTAFDLIIRKPTKEGNYIYTKWDFIAMADANNQPDYILCIGMEITSYIEDAAAHLLKLQEIAFDQSHMVRKPLANILGLTKLLLEVHLDSETERNMLISQLHTIALELDDALCSVSVKVLSNP